ncbi:DUF2155 domain-containing protein [Brevundimonas sp.]|uniref:DUF2155 domain-containing protein n=1 Tax=Brevundimonas sp. TaxID=1871086 RepID=UPI00289DDC8D|nr:DUF2155 domain-containing protein [Brevundimonas sp.]
MTPRRLLLIGVAAAGLAVSGAGVADALLDLPQDAVPVQDPVGDLLRDTNRAPLQGSQSTPPASTAPVQNVSPPTDPTAAPGTPVVVVTPEAEIAAVQEDVPPEAEIEAPKPAAEPAATPGRRQRRPTAVIQAIDKVTAESMRFEVEVGGRPVRFNKTLIFSVRACEISASDEQTEDAIAYLEVGVQPRGIAVPTEARQIFKGWMFASSPGVSGLQHPIYDAWVVGCKA